MRSKVKTLKNFHDWQHIVSAILLTHFLLIACLFAHGETVKASKVKKATTTKSTNAKPITVKPKVNKPTVTKPRVVPPVPQKPKNIAPAVVEAIKSAQERAQDLTAQGVEKFNEGQFDVAVTLLNQSLTIAEPVYETHFWLGRIFALKAGTSPEARQKAIKHFHRALVLQPYGEEGDLSRGWLARFDGRPKRVIVSSMQDSILKTYDGDSTEAVVRMLLATLRAANIPTTSINNGPINLLNQDTDSLARTCQNDKGEMENGWLIGIAVEKLEGSNSRAKIWIFDPLAKQLYDPTSVSTSFELPQLEFKSSDAPTTGNVTLDSLETKIWQRCRPIVANDSNPKVLDEVQFPSAIDGVYARSIAPYETALKLPLIMLAPVKADSENEDTAREIGINLQQAILEPAQYSLISPGGTQQVLKELKLDFNSIDSSGWVRAGQAANCRYVVVPSLTRFDLKTKPMVIVTTVKASVALKIVIIDCLSGKEVSAKTYEKSSSTTKFIKAGLNSLFAKRTEILNQVIGEATTDIAKLNTITSQP